MDGDAEAWRVFFPPAAFRVHRIRANVRLDARRDRAPVEPQLKRAITERYTDWAGTWGVSLAFAVTQSVDAAEAIVADAIVGVIAALAAVTNASDASLSVVKDSGRGATKRKASRFALPASVNAIRFATAIWDASQRQAFRGHTQDPFFRMSPATRAAVLLKLKVGFSRDAVAVILGLPPALVNEHLQNARLLFAKGKAWIVESPGVTVPESPLPFGAAKTWIPECPQWAGSDGYDVQDLWARYLGHDLDPAAEGHLHQHLIACSVCRASFVKFKDGYADWASAIPIVEVEPELKSHLRKISRMALSAHDKPGAPSPWPGMRKLLRDPTAQNLMILFLFLLTIHWLSHQ